MVEGALHVDKLPMSARDMGVWASIILLASGSRRLGQFEQCLLQHEFEIIYRTEDLVSSNNVFYNMNLKSFIEQTTWQFELCRLQHEFEIIFSTDILFVLHII